jgi:hypothetical protein
VYLANLTIEINLGINGAGIDATFLTERVSPLSHMGRNYGEHRDPTPGTDTAQFRRWHLQPGALVLAQVRGPQHGLAAEAYRCNNSLSMTIQRVEPLRTSAVIHLAFGATHASPT